VINVSPLSAVRSECGDGLHGRLSKEDTCSSLQDSGRRLIVTTTIVSSNSSTESSHVVEKTFMYMSCDTADMYIEGPREIHAVVPAYNTTSREDTRLVPSRGCNG